MKKYKPGQKCPASGQYALVNPSGSQSKREVTVVKGEPFPPTPKTGYSYKLSDATKH